MLPTDAYFIRHGDYLYRSGFPLSPKGQEQARHSGLELKALELSDPTLIASPVERTLEYASIISEELDIPFTTHAELSDIPLAHPKIRKDGR